MDEQESAIKKFVLKNKEWILRKQAELSKKFNKNRNPGVIPDEKKQYESDGIKYTISRDGRKSGYQIAVNPDGSVVVKASMDAQESVIKMLVFEAKSWILRKQAELSKKFNTNQNPDVRPDDKKQHDAGGIKYTISRSNRRSRLQIAISPDGLVVVKAPTDAQEPAIKKFVFESRGWILRKQAELSKKFNTNQNPDVIADYNKQYDADGIKYTISRNSRRTRLRVVPRSDGTVEAKSPTTMSNSDIHQIILSNKIRIRSMLSKYAKLPKGKMTQEIRTRKQLENRTLHLAVKMGVNPSGILIKTLKSRWGSCTESGIINFSSAMLKMPSPVMDYIIIHELSHLKIKNHSSQFWDLVYKYDPNYKKHVAWLKENAETLL